MTHIPCVHCGRDKAAHIAIGDGRALLCAATGQLARSSYSPCAEPVIQTRSGITKLACGCADPDRLAWCILPPGHSGKHEDSWGKQFNAIVAPTAIYLVFYLRPETEDELFLSAHATIESARRAAEADARDQGHKPRVPRWTPGSTRIPNGWRWGLGPDGPRNPSVAGDGKENPDVLTDWTDMDDSGQYQIISAPLHQ